MFLFKCTGCGTTFSSGDELAGRQMNCPKCARPALVPTKSPVIPGTTPDSRQGADLPRRGPPPMAIGPDSSPLSVTVICPRCERIFQLRPDGLAHTIECADCNLQFVAGTGVVPSHRPAPGLGSPPRSRRTLLPRPSPPMRAVPSHPGKTGERHLICPPASKSLRDRRLLR
jgi:DNA-directed RNA polymerase subunit RPC12/RpoP